MPRLDEILSYAYLIPSLLILGSCVYYISQKMTPQGILLLVGSLAQFATNIFHRVVAPNLLRNTGSYDDIKEIYAFVGLVGIVGYTLFGVGLLLLIIDSVKSTGTEPKRFF
jgi:hypothetical protein